MLGVVSGRRMGKTYLLRALTEARGGFYFGATAATADESLRQFGAALARHAGAPAPFSFGTWDDAVSSLFALAAPDRGESPLLIVIDEFPYLAKAAPELPSLIQRETDRFQVRESRMRMLLCGSAIFAPRLPRRPDHRVVVRQVGVGVRGAPAGDRPRR
ncbi:ATP-binding protein [Streptomyces polyrhachis]|uniref:ATP-binding protein n=1 Tax=Streptomyces polyrhachis TaxID=1282885 RepID=A0ABW2GDI1_9ACTN